MSVQGGSALFFFFKKVFKFLELKSCFISAIDLAFHLCDLLLELIDLVE